MKESLTSPILTDDSPMPFGKHKGELLVDIPADYFHWLWTEGGMSKQDSPIANYIRASLPALRLERQDLLWD
jgi:hypothetical protein